MSKEKAESFVQDLKEIMLKHGLVSMKGIDNDLYIGFTIIDAGDTILFKEPFFINNVDFNFPDVVEHRICNW